MKTLAILTIVTLAGLRLHAGVITLEPADYVHGVALTTIIPEATLNTVDASGTIDSLFTVESDTPAEGKLAGIAVFSSKDIDFWNENQRLRIDFNVPTTAVQIDFIGGANLGTAIGTLDVYDSLGDPLGEYTTAPLTVGETETMMVSGLAPGEAAYAVATGENGGFGRLTNLQVNQVPEPASMVLLLAGLGVCLHRRRLRPSR